MKNPDEILGSLLWQKTSERFRQWARKDRFTGIPPSDGRQLLPEGVSSIAELIGVVLRGQAHGTLVKGEQPSTCTLQNSLRELLSLTARSNVGRAPVRELFLTALCAYPLQQLLEEALIHPRSPEGAVEHARLWADARCSGWRELSARIHRDGNVDVLADALLDVLLDEVGDKPLSAFFEVPVGPFGYRTGVPRMFTGGRAALATHEQETRGATARVRVQRYEHASDAGIRAYEWHAGLWAPGEPDTPRAAACGMVYVLARQDKKTLNTPFDLRYAADAVADADFLQVDAFLTQHEDAPERMDAGDLCFVWLWERREDAEKGAGVALLTVALQDLKKRFSGLRTLVVSARPAQFSAKASKYEPPEVQVQRQDALESLERLFDQAAPQRHLNGELRLIQTRETITRQELTHAMRGG